MEERPRISPPPLDELLASARRSCFICDIVDGRDRRHHVVYENEIALALLNRFPALYGYVLVAPRD